MVVFAPSEEAIKAIHKTLIRRRGVDGYISEGMVEGCIERAMTYVYDFEPFPKLFIKAAVILYSFIIFHPFVDGNKRTAFETTRVFLLLNGYDFKATTEEGVQFTKDIAEFKITDIDVIVRWIQEHSKRKLNYLLLNLLMKWFLRLYSAESFEELEKLSFPHIELFQIIKVYPN